MSTFTGAPGHAPIPVVDDEAASAQDENPVVAAFLGFIENDMKTHPGRRTRLSKASLRRAVRLTKSVKVAGYETIPESVTF